MTERVKITGSRNIADALGCFHRLQKSPHYHALRETLQVEIMAAWLAILSHWGTAPVTVVAKVKTPSGARVDVTNLARLRFVEPTAECWPQLIEPCGQVPLIDAAPGFAEGQRVFGPTADIVAINRLVEDWNQAAEQLGLRHCASVTESRRRAARDRLSDPEWRDKYREGLIRIAKSEFLRGYRQAGKSKPFVANVDWFLRPDTLTQILEGKYDD